MFKERFLVFKSPEKGGSAGGREVPAGKISKEGEMKRPAFDPKGERAKASAEFAEKLAENDSAVYEKAIKVLESTGLKREECEAILDDDTNPYTPMFMDFAERMGEKGWTLDIKNTGRNWAGFRLKGGITGTPDFVNKMLLWKDVIYPRLVKTLGSFYNEDLIRVMVLHDLYGAHKLLKNLEYSTIPEKGLVDWTKWEIGQLASGVSFEDLVKMEKEMLAKRKSRADALAEFGIEDISDEELMEKLKKNPKIELPEEDEISDRMEEENRKAVERMKRADEAKNKFFPGEVAKINGLVDRVPDPKDISSDDYEGFTEESSQLIDDLAGKSPAVAGVKDRVEDALQEYETLIASAGEYSSQKAEHFLDDSGVEEDFEKTLVDALAAGDEETVAALSVYEDVIKARLDVSRGYYKSGD